jgi:5-formyltetrahydrofolate cyclo-ligase
MTLDDIKKAARKEAMARRAEAYRAGQGQAAEILADFLERHPGKALSGYMPMRTEIDPLPAMAAHDGPVAVPVIEAPAAPLRFREWSPGCALVDGPFGAKVPADGAWIDPEILIVPLLAIDARGYRLGYGGGFYDRTLAGLRAKGPRIAVGFAFAAQEIEQVPIDSFDQRLDYLVTELGLRKFR